MFEWELSIVQLAMGKHLSVTVCVLAHHEGMIRFRLRPHNYLLGEVFLAEGCVLHTSPLVEPCLVTIHGVRTRRREHRRERR